METEWQDSQQVEEWLQDRQSEPQGAEHGIRQSKHISEKAYEPVGFERETAYAGTRAAYWPL